MFAKVEIDGKEVELVANAATPFRFKQVFHKDLLQIVGNEKRAQEEGAEIVMELAYIMANAAKKADMNKLNEEMFIEWLEGFSPMAFMNAAGDIMDVYMGSSESTSTP